MKRIQFLKEVKQRIEKNPTCIEIGVWKGGFSTKIYEALNPSVLHLLDPWEIGFDKNGPTTHYSGRLSHLSTVYSTKTHYEEVNDKFKDQIKSKTIILHKGYSYDFATSFEDNYFDFIYIDSCHLYESVKADLEMYLPKLKSNGLLCGHDYLNHPSFGVIKAVDEFCKKYDFKMILKSDESDWALIKN